MLNLRLKIPVEGDCFVLILIGHISTLHHHSVYYLVSQNVVNHLRVLNVNNLVYKKTKIQKNTKQIRLLSATLATLVSVVIILLR